VATRGTTQVWAKELADGSKAVGLFNLGDDDAPVAVSFDELGLRGALLLRDLWRQKDLGTFSDRFETKVPFHGVALLRVTPRR
jgi:alpha-galactosidase